MKFSNNLKLTAPLVHALTDDDYDPGKGDYTPSSLSRPAYMAALEKKFDDQIVVDCASRVWTLLGKATHNIVEIASKGVVNNRSEERVYCKIGKWLISMKFDNLFLDIKNSILEDYKTTSVYKFKPDFQGTLPEADDWDAQLNIGAYILRHDWHTHDGENFIEGKAPIQLKEIRIIGILKDHRKVMARSDKTYPRHPIATRSFQIWSDEKLEAYVTEKANAQDFGKKNEIKDIPVCTKKEMWSTPDKWALMKKGLKRAVKLHVSEESAIRAKTEDKHYVEFRPGERKRCIGYCDCSAVCPSYQNFLQGDKQ